MKNKYGFTLAELLSVVVILSVLTTIAVPQYTKSIQRTEAANALISLKTVYDSAKRYYSSFGSWPTSFSGLDAQLVLNTKADGSKIPIGDAWYGASGAYQFVFPSASGTYVQACKTIADDAGAPDQLYCLIATFSYGSDTYTCQYKKTKYKSLCESMCKDTMTGTTCTIK